MMIRDVTLRDGLQSIQNVLSTASKLEIYELIAATGVDEIQLTSFVSPKRLPQLADAEPLWLATDGLPGKRSALIANLKGFWRALEAGVTTMEMVVALSPSYHRRNSRLSQEASFDEFLQMRRLANEKGVALSIGFANSWHCSFEGPTPRARVREWVDKAVECGTVDICLSDTTGQADPNEVSALVAEVKEAHRNVFLRTHLHDGPYGVENARRAALAGADSMDATLLGLGGSPFAGEVGGNLSHRQLVDAELCSLDESALDAASMALKRTLSDIRPMV